MLVKVETRHNGDTRTPRKYRTKKSLSVNMSACEDIDEETHTQARGGLDERRLGGAKKEEHSLCANTLTLDRHVDSALRRRYCPQNGRGGKEERYSVETRYQKRPKLVPYLRLARARARLFRRISHGETSVPSAS